MASEGITVLIATRNRGDMVLKCITSLITNTACDYFEIIVLDQSDEFIALDFNDDRIRHIHIAQRGKSHALNIGLHLVSYQSIGIIDDDCVVDCDWIQSMYNSISSLEDFQLITGRVIAGKIEGSSQISILHDNIEIQKVYKKRFITPIFKMSGCNFGFHRSTINTIGFFDENFGPGAKFKSSDDNEWCYRALHDYCYELIYQPNVVVIHRSWRNLREEEIQFKDYGYSAGVFFRYMLTKSKPDFLIHILQMMSWVISSMLFSSERKRGLQKAYVTEFYKGFRAYVNI